jgi:hypothetical protein
MLGSVLLFIKTHFPQQIDGALARIYTNERFEMVGKGEMNCRRTKTTINRIRIMNYLNGNVVKRDRGFDAGNGGGAGLFLV